MSLETTKVAPGRQPTGAEGQLEALASHEELEQGLGQRRSMKKLKRELVVCDLHQTGWKLESEPE